MYKLHFTLKVLSLFCIVMPALLITMPAAAQNYPQLADPEPTPEQGYSLSIDINMTTLPELGQVVPVKFSVSSNNEMIKNVKIELLLPSEIQLVKNLQQSQLEFVDSNQASEQTFSFITQQAGQHKITLKVTGWTAQGDFKDRYEYLFFNVDEDRTKNQTGWPKPVQDTEDDSWSDSELFERVIDSEGFITVPAADVNLNETTSKISASQYYAAADNSSESTGSTVTISGRYQFRNRENTAYLGFKNNLMRLINSSTGDHLAWTYSDNNGNFTFPAVTNPDNDGMRVRAYAVRYLTGGKGYGVCEYPSCEDGAAADSGSYDQFYYRQTLEFIRADGNQHIGTYTSGYSLTNSLRALWIKNDMDLAHAHLILNTSIRGPFTAEWAGDSTHGNHYHRDGNLHLKSDVGDGTNHTVLHELGHNVMWNAGTFPAGTDCPSPHFINRVSGPQCAWTEGWAHIFLTLVNDDPIKCSPPSTTSCTLFETDPSYDNCDSNWDCSADSDQVEGHVTGAVWDLYDDTSDDFDIEEFSIDKIYNILETDTNNSFASWWNSWLNYGNSSLGLNSLFQNDILYGDLYDVAVTNQTVDDNSPSTGQDITVGVSLRNLGDVSSIATNTNFYLSNNPIISHADQLMGTHNLGVLDKNLAVFVNQTFSIDTPGTFWVGACFADSYGLDQNTSNNCSLSLTITVTDNDVIFASDFE